MKQLQEHDAMICRSCGNEERASEGYPCLNCGTFLCVICDLRGIWLCRICQAKHDATMRDTTLQSATTQNATIRTNPIE